jgi:glycosyltransferase involved in cell wall biosynthesis
MRIAIATDAWYPQVNGVVRTLAATVAELDRRGYEVELVTPQRFVTVPMPGYSSIRLALAPRYNVRKMLGAFRPDVVHISTEGPIGWSARAWCKLRDVPFTSAFHTRFPEYASVRTGISAERFWPILRRFHQPSQAVMVATGSLEQELATRGIGQTARWSRGIDRWLFRPRGRSCSTSAGSRSKRTWKHSSRQMSPEPRWWSAKVRRSTACARAIPTWCSPARWRAKNWLRPIAAPIASSFPAAPIRSDW